MIPVLYASTETDYSHNGLGLLADCLQCQVTEERNGVFELLMRYPVEGQHYGSIADGCLIKAKPNETDNDQVFRIYRSTKPIDGMVTYYAQHLSYDLNDNPVIEFSAQNVSASTALTSLLSKTVYSHPFTAWSDITTANSTVFSEPLSVRAILAGTAGSLLDRWGGEYEFDNTTVKLHANRGAVTDVVIAYGKNLTGFQQDSNIADVYTALLPFAKYTEDTDGAEERTVYLPEKVLPAPGTFDHNKAMIRDFSDEFEDGVVITATMLRAKAQAYMSANPIHVPTVSITVSYTQLYQSPEYADLAPLERVGLCDIVTIRFPMPEVDATAKVIKTVYDSLEEKYIKIELGDAKANFADTLNKQRQEISGIATTIKEGDSRTASVLKQAILDATNAITGNSGGYVALYPAENPQELLIMDTPDRATAVNVWRWNLSGLGHSSNGYNGPFDDVALTADGKINATLITAGTLNADIIKAGILTSQNGKTLWDIDTGELISENDSGNIRVIMNSEKGFAVQALESNRWVDKAAVDPDGLAANKIRTSASPVYGVIGQGIGRDEYGLALENQSGTVFSISVPSSGVYGSTYILDGGGALYIKYGPMMGTVFIGTLDALHLEVTNSIYAGGNISASGDVSGGSLAAQNGKSGTFTSANGKTITVTKGIITGIA